MRFRAFAACASFDRSGVQLPWVLGLDLRLNFMRLCYCVVLRLLPSGFSGLRRCRASRFLGRSFPSGFAAFCAAFVGRQFAAAVWAGFHGSSMITLPIPILMPSCLRRLTPAM
jgi:hypothetical protein